MADVVKRALAKLVRETIAAELKERGETTPGMIADLVCDNHGETIEPFGRRLVRAAISQMASGQLRSWFAVSLAGEAQPSLPGLPEDVISEMPPTITVPAEDGSETRHVLLSKVTVGQVRAYDRMLDGQRRADAKRHRAVQFVTARTKGASDDMLLRDALLAKLQAKQTV